MLTTIQKFLLRLWLISIMTTNIVLANVPFYPIQFPRDDAGHLTNVPYPVKNLSEWWYYSGKITTAEGRHFGYYFIIFNITKNMFGKKVSLPIYTMQLTDIDNNKVYGNMIYYSNKDTQFSTDELEIALGKTKEVKLKKNNVIYTIDATTNTKQGIKVKLLLTMKPIRKPLLIGTNGLIPMGNDTNSYYYSFTKMTTSGSMQIGNQIFKINPAKSDSWMDHQWGDFILSSANKWFWTSIRLDNGIEINLTNILNSKKEPGQIKMTNIMMPDGKALFTSDFYVKQTIHDSHSYPLIYDIEIKPIQLKLHITSLADNQNCNTFWEGISKVEGTYKGKSLKGYAYVENTSRYGYPLAVMFDEVTFPITQLWHVMRALGQ